MRIEPYSVGSYLHVIKRGGRGLHIFGDESDKWRFLRTLYYKNDSFSTENWDRETADGNLFNRPEEWPKQDPIVNILCYTFLPNHFHLLLKEIKEGGISTFMQKICCSMTNHFNEKYESKGSIFQGAYKGKTVENDEYLRYVAVYIMVKNTFEMYSNGGLEGAIKNFEDAWEWGIHFPFSSLADYAGGRKSPIINKDIIGEIFMTPNQLKSFAKDVILGGKWLISC